MMAAVTTWAPSHDAPRDRPVWLYVPTYSWKADPNGRPTEVVNAARVAKWDRLRAAWIDRETHQPVYPSLWCDADPNGVMPDFPMIDLSGH